MNSYHYRSLGFYSYFDRLGSNPCPSHHEPQHPEPSSGTVPDPSGILNPEPRHSRSLSSTNLAVEYGENWMKGRQHETANEPGNNRPGFGGGHTRLNGRHHRRVQRLNRIESTILSALSGCHILFDNKIYILLTLSPHYSGRAHSLSAVSSCAVWGQVVWFGRTPLPTIPFQDRTRKGHPNSHSDTLPWS
ncbi:hypothetical protein EYR41_003798 [Orbilia oligospora]|uniref:Uncharacterized protein n=1 Tax=Orbilia oligospora TaxID=2813651 RepID=A0A8H2HUN6_ORBOL|nr:hypothetical protein EYR41_003798 [Orbilia oligospora]